MWNNGRAAITTSSSVTWWTSHVWHRLATRFWCVSSTLLGSPVVPLDVGRSAISDAETRSAWLVCGRAKRPEGDRPGGVVTDHDRLGDRGLGRHAAQLLPGRPGRGHQPPRACLPELAGDLIARALRVHGRHDRADRSGREPCHRELDGVLRAQGKDVAGTQAAR
jgi:hypothetical protein